MTTHTRPPQTSVVSSRQRQAGRTLLTTVLPPELGLVLTIVLLFVAGTLTTPGFASGENLAAILLSASITGIVAVSMTPMILSGHFVSIAGSASAALAAVVFIELVNLGWSVWPAGALTLAALVAIGLVQGLVVSGGLNPILTTLATATVVLGVLATVTGGVNVSFADGGPTAGNMSVLGLQLPSYAFLAVTLLLGVFVRKTVLGRQLVLFGASRETALLSGISALKVALTAFGIFSVGVTLAGILWAAQLGVAGVATLPNLTVNSIAAVLIGGNAIHGGNGSPIRAAIGAVLVSQATNIMLLNDASNGVQQAVVGGIVLVVVVVLHIVARKSGR